MQVYTNCKTNKQKPILIIEPETKAVITEAAEASKHIREKVEYTSIFHVEKAKYLPIELPKANHSTILRKSM